MVTVPLGINTDDLYSQFAVSQDDVKSILDGVAKGVAFLFFLKVEEVAIKTLGTTRDIYMRNLKLVDQGRLQGTVLLDYSKEEMVRKIEEGSPPFDMKIGLLKGPNAKITKKGVRYNTVPFKWGVPTTQNSGGIFSGIMPQEVYQEILAQPVDVPVSGGGMRTQGLSVSGLSAQSQTPRVRPAIVDSKGKVLFNQYTHKNSVYEGIVRKVDPKTLQATYYSFRRVSENSDPMAFIHKGFVARDVMGKAFQEFDASQEVGLLIDKELQKLGF